MGEARVFTKFGLAVQDLNFYPCLPIEVFSQAFRRVFSGSVKVTLISTYSPLTKHTSFCVLHVVGKGLAGWGSLYFCFVLNCSVQKFCFFPTSCLQGFEMRAQNHTEKPTWGREGMCQQHEITLF